MGTHTRRERVAQLAFLAYAEAEAVRQLIDQHLVDYRANPAAARALISTGVAPTPEGLDATELAAWTHVARVLLNLHETVTRS